MEGLQRKQDRFVLLGQAGTMVAEIVFDRPVPDRIVISHTFVDQSLSGLGIGKQLVLEVVKLGQAEGRMLESTCSFATKVLEKLKKP